MLFVRVRVYFEWEAQRERERKRYLEDHRENNLNNVRRKQQIFLRKSDAVTGTNQSGSYVSIE